MLLALVVLLVALVVGWAGGGRLWALGQLELRSRRLVVAAVAVQAAGAVAGGAGGPAYAAGLAVSAVLVAAFLVRNRGIRGTGLVALGLVSNAVVVGVNGAMPVSGAAAGRAGVSTQAIVSGEDARHALAGPTTRLGLLGDVIPVLLPFHPEVVSPGDVLVVAGLGQLVAAGMWAARRRD